MRARIEAAQKRRSQRRARCICFWSFTLAGLVAGGFLLRGKPVPVVSISRSAHQQDGSTNTATITSSAKAAVSAAEQKPFSAAATADNKAKEKQQKKEKQYYYTGEKENMEHHEIVEEPIPADCHPEQNADYGGTGLSWGLTYKTASAAQCCAACKDGASGGCNVWVWCGDTSGICWTPDLWNHTTGACWLKKQENWDGNTDLSKTNLIVNVRGAYSAEFRAEHKTAPERVPWIAGLVKSPG